MVKERYENINGIRAYACIGIVLMHVLANGNYGLSGAIFTVFIPSMTKLTFLFMMLSAFSMCCGYYERLKSNSISLERFYMRRYQRIWPFFALLCTLELIMDHSIKALYEWFADITLVFGLLPNAAISVVGVGWFIGTIFSFYMLFPFFVFLLANKKRAWIVFGATVILNFLCLNYFLDTNHIVEGFHYRENIIYSAMFFVAGGMIYLYRDIIMRMSVLLRALTIIIAASVLVMYYVVFDSDFIVLLLFALFTIICLAEDGGALKVLLQNKAILFISNLSMEVYLCHMFVFRLLERFKLLHMTSNEVTNYIFVCIFTVSGAVIVAYAWQILIKRGVKYVR